MRGVEGLRLFCDDVASDQPAPGGGSVSSAAGAMSASLLRMVCGVSARAKARQEHREELQTLDIDLKRSQDSLIELSERDAEAYEELARAMRKYKGGGGHVDSERLQAALRHAAEVPAETARACVSVLERSIQVARVSVKGAWSDIGVAVLLAEAGVLGASLNVRINTAEIADRDFSAQLETELNGLAMRASEAKEEALKLIGELRPRS